MEEATHEHVRSQSRVCVEDDATMTYMAQTSDIKAKLKRLVEVEEVDKAIALEVMNLHYDMESLLMQSEHDRVRQLQELHNRVAIDDLKKLYETEQDRIKQQHATEVRSMQSTIQTMQVGAKKR